MLKKYWFSAVLVFALLLSASCSTLNVGNSNPEREAASFTLDVMDESFFNGSSVDNIFLTTKEGEDYYQVSINVEGATDLKALYFSMDYNPDEVIPMGVINSDLIADSDEIITLTHEGQRGVIQSGQLVMHPDWHAGFNGDGVLATVNFRKERTPLLRESSAVNTSAGGGAIEPAWDGTDTLTWWYNNPADYDQNGEVGISDLTPLGINLNADATGATFMDALSVVDGDSNGLVTLADITPIGVNFGNSANGGYNVYAGDKNTDLPATNGGADVVSPLDNVDFSAAVGTNVDRKMWSYTVAAPNAGDDYWVRAVSAGAELGTPSDTVGGDPANDPTIELDSPTPGSGNGSSATPWIVTDAQVAATFTFSVYASPNDGGAEVTGDAGVTIASDPAGAIDTVTQASGEVVFDNTFVDTTFYVSADVSGAETNRIYFRIELAPVGLYIFTDPADADWSGLSGDGLTSETAIAIATDTFNTDGSVEFSFVANDAADNTGNSIDVNTLTWDSEFEFMVTNAWSTPGTATFDENFTNTRVFAVDGDLNNSNDIFVYADNLPE